jgi:hypothetical protein
VREFGTVDRVGCVADSDATISPSHEPVESNSPSSGFPHRSWGTQEVEDESVFCDRIVSDLKRDRLGSGPSSCVPSRKPAAEWTTRYRAGDFDPNNTGAVGVCFINNSSLVACETVINVKPDVTSVVTGAT